MVVSSEVLTISGACSARTEVQRLWHVIDHSHPSRAEVENEWSYTSSPPLCLLHAVNVYRGANVYVHDERYQLDATIYLLSYITLHVSGIYMPIFRSTDCILLHMVFSTRCCV